MSAWLSAVTCPSSVCCFFKFFISVLDNYKKMDDKYELLISLVQGYPHLYDKSCKNFKDQRMRENSWRKISEELEMPMKDCQRIWLNLRNKYGREKKALPSGSGAPVTPQWEYLESMSFLNAYVKPRNTHTTTPVVAQKSQPTKTTLYQCAPPLQSPIFSDTSTCYSSAWSNSSMIPSPTPDMPMSPQSNNENEERDSQEESIDEENIIIQIEETEEQTPTVNAETVQLAGKGKSKNKKNTMEPDPSKGVVDAAKSITQHLKNLSQKKQELKTSADVLGEYIASILKEMTPEKQKIKRQRLLDILEDDD